jgi:phytoene dehydrogenase-like protein
VLDKPMRSLGFDASITFYNQGERFEWRSPREQLVDLRSSVLCVPDNFAHTVPMADHRIRVTHLAHNRRWFELDEESYQGEKTRMISASVSATASVTGDFRSSITYTDAFTPRTVTQYTGHVNGAIYGSPHKSKTGRTDLANLFIMGTDQGMLGIVGAMLSGIAVANTAAGE